MGTMKKIGFLCCVLLVSAVAANATPISDDLSAFSAGFVTDTSGGVHYRVDYAVYDLTVAYTGFDPSWGTAKWLYAYQVSNLQDSTEAMNVFSVAIPQGVVADNIAYDWTKGLTLGIPSMSQQFVGDSAVWQFAANHTIAPTKNSVVLIFTSDLGPGEGSGTIVSDGGSLNISNIATPVPEPLTLALLGIGGAALLRRRSH
jgi:hypothetical protein